MKSLFVIVFIAIASSVFAQKLKTNYGLDSSGYTIAYSLLHDKYDDAIAYTTEGFWQSDHIHYGVLANKGGFFFKGIIELKRRKDRTWSKPLLMLKKVNIKKAQDIVQQLEQLGLWALSNDSLNNQMKRKTNGAMEKEVIHDDTNYRFELIERDRFLTVEAYAPEYFAEELPEYKQRAVFIKIRDQFLKEYQDLK